MNYIPYLYRQCYWPFKTIYNQYHDNHYSRGDEFEKLFIVRNNEIVVQGMWRMQLLAELHSGINVLCYDDHTNWEYYDEVIYQIDSEEDREEFRRENYDPDKYDLYYEELAEVAAELGCERVEIKCLIKSLMMKYRFEKVRTIDDFPHEAFKKIYNRLTSSNDPDQLRVAERLGRYHILQLKWFMYYNINEKKRKCETSLSI